jgi:hypothetical protein
VTHLALESVDAFEEATRGLTGAVCGRALRDLGRLMREHPTGAAGEASAMAETTRRIADCLEAADEALAKGDPDSAALEWARAQVLIVALNRRLETAAAADPYPKSGSAR